MIRLRSLDLQGRHDYVLKTFISKRGTECQRQKRDIDVIREHHKFLWDDDDIPGSWESKLARKYYERLFKEYCIADLRHFKENKIAMRWRTEQEVITGKGHFQCGNRGCLQKDMLRSWEVNFAYLEGGIKKNALVKLRLCEEHSAQLNYVSRKREAKKHNQKSKNRGDAGANVKEGVADNKDSSCTKSINGDAGGVVAPKKIKYSGDNQSIEQNGEKDISDETIWKRKREVDTEETTRETEFERYLEDLLL